MNGRSASSIQFQGSWTFGDQSSNTVEPSNPTRGAFSESVRAVAGSLLCGTCFVHLGAIGANLYESIGPDGAPRYATQALDNSYRLIQQDPAIIALPAPVGRFDRGKSQSRLLPLIERSALQHGVSAALVEAVVAVESGHNPSAVSPKGAMGAMQLMPATAARYGLEARGLFDAQRNIDAGVRHLKDLLSRHGEVSLALAAYNAGSGAVDRSGGQIPPYPETLAYVAAVMARAARVSSP